LPPIEIDGKHPSPFRTHNPQGLETCRAMNYPAKTYLSKAVTRAGGTGYNPVQVKQGFSH
jgi:hypothetical protein